MVVTWTVDADGYTPSRLATPAPRLVSAALPLVPHAARFLRVPPLRLALPHVPVAGLRLPRGLDLVWLPVNGRLWAFYANGTHVPLTAHLPTP